MLVREGGGCHSTFQLPPPSVFIWDHDAVLVTSEYLLWLSTFPLSFPFPEQESSSPPEETARQMLRTPAFILYTCPFHGKNNLPLKVTLLLPKLCRHGQTNLTIQKEERPIYEKRIMHKETVRTLNG